MMSSPQRSSARNVQSGVSATILLIITRWGLPKLQSKDVHRLWLLKWKRYFVFHLSLSILIVGTFRVSKSSMHWIHWRDGVLYLGWIWHNGVQVFYSTCFEEEELVKKAGIITLVTVQPEYSEFILLKFDWCIGTKTCCRTRWSTQRCLGHEACKLWSCTTGVSRRIGRQWTYFWSKIWMGANWGKTSLVSEYQAHWTLVYSSCIHHRWFYQLGDHSKLLW